MLKKVFLLFLVVLGFQVHNVAQIQEPTKFTVEIKPTKYKVGDQIEIIFNAKIDKGWHLYSTGFDENIGPIPTNFVFTKSSDYELIGGIKPINAHEVYEVIWEAKIPQMTNNGQFIQKIKILKQNFKINSHIEFQTCQGDGVCTQGKKDFIIKIKAEQGSNTSIIDSFKKTSSISTDTNSKSASIISNNKNQISNPATENGGMWELLLTAFLAGLASIFMPCIFPIMPMTVSFFTKQQNGKVKAIFYGICIMLIFGAMGLVTRALGAPFLNFLSTHWVPNLIFFIVFIVFGFSLLGAFEIVLPHNTVNKVDQLSEKGGIIGIFFMALTLVLVSFSCTVPFVGSILIAASQGQVSLPILAMLAFGFPFALVFGGLAMFPSLLKSLPKSGGWLNEVKAVMGFLEFAFAFKFLSNIDLVYDFNVLHRNIFLGIWIVFAVIIVIYIIGFARLPNDKKIEKLTLPRIFFAGLFSIFTIYMFTGLPNKSLSLLSGILPPMPIMASSENTQTHTKQIPHGLIGYEEIEYAIEEGKKQDKPVFIDFTGKACANCRKMEENVWNQSKILPLLKNDFVIASLYVDYKKELAAERQYISKYDGSKITTVGEKNMDYEISKFNNNAQPLYVILDKEGNSLLPPIAYTSKENFEKFLNEGLAKYKSQ